MLCTKKVLLDLVGLNTPESSLSVTFKLRMVAEVLVLRRIMVRGNSLPKVTFSPP